ncbi:MAG: HAD family phosphatase [Proteobacteria bacterium]|nr:HAD family phosphatase [Pseudomonadota bacterium]
MRIKNIVFDVGNVLVRYDPVYIIAKSFPEHPNQATLVQEIFKHETWLALNLGYITEAQALLEYHSRLGLEIERLQQMAQITKESLTPIAGAQKLLRTLHGNYPLYALTDNTHEIMAYLRARYDFWPLFKGVVVSAHIGHLKPSAEIYRHLLKTYQLSPEETLFLDDVIKNIEGAKAVGIQAVQFKDTEQIIEELKRLGVVL